MNRREFIAGAVAAAVVPSIPALADEYTFVPGYEIYKPETITGCYELRPFKIWTLPQTIEFSQINDPTTFDIGLMPPARCPKGSNCEECWPKVVV